MTIMAGPPPLVKAELAARHPADREAYTDGKGPFVARVLERARSAGG
ncbi:MAG TPA: hypothetical protein VF263_12775 [Longimicrobiaceae bacterium]